MCYYLITLMLLFSLLADCADYTLVSYNVKSYGDNYKTGRIILKHYSLHLAESQGEIEFRVVDFCTKNIDVNDKLINNPKPKLNKLAFFSPKGTTYADMQQLLDSGMLQKPPRSVKYGWDDNAQSWELFSETFSRELPYTALSTFLQICTKKNPGLLAGVGGFRSFDDFTIVKTNKSDRLIYYYNSLDYLKHFFKNGDVPSGYGGGIYYRVFYDNNMINSKIPAFATFYYSETGIYDAGPYSLAQGALLYKEDSNLLNTYKLFEGIDKEFLCERENGKILTAVLNSDRQLFYIANMPKEEWEDATIKQELLDKYITLWCK